MDLSQVQHSPMIEEIVDVICTRTQIQDRGYYRVVTAYALARMASCMRASVVTRDMGEIPTNIYALCLAESGYSKGKTVNLLEEEFCGGFKKKFMDDTFPEIEETHLLEIAQDRALRNGTTEEAEMAVAQNESKRLGTYVFTFDDGSSPAIKQMRDKLLLCGAGSINLQIDELGQNLESRSEALNVYLELYDKGKVKPKLTKNTNDNTRSVDRDGCTPTNLLMFGTPANILNGSSTEDAFYQFLQIGYARRCIFGMGKIDKRASYTKTPEEIFYEKVNPANTMKIQKWADRFTKLADPAMYNWKMSIQDETSILLQTYQCECEKLADSLPSHEELKKIEISHRYFRALKVATTLAFCEQSPEVTQTHILQAIKLVEESGQSFQDILRRPKTYMKLAKYIAEVGNEVTHADLTETLPFYKGTGTQRKEMMDLAIGWGYKNNIIIKKVFQDGIEFFTGATLKNTDINNMIVSYSQDFAQGYVPEYAPWNQMQTLFQYDGMNWCNHHFKMEHRSNEDTLPPFNMLVIDCDGTATIDMVKELFKEYTYAIYTTKRHGENGKDRFRLVLPMEYVLEFAPTEYKEFMNNVLQWLPFETDDHANVISQKWLSHAGGTYITNDGILFNPLKFIPNTKRNEEYQKDFAKVQSLPALERWFASRMSEGNRNNMMIKYALALIDQGMTFTEVAENVYRLNKSLAEPLPKEEIDNSILVTVAKKANA